MPSVKSHQFSENVIGAAYLGRVALFALADGLIQRDDGETVTALTAHDGSILATALTGPAPSITSATALRPAISPTS